MHQQSDAMECRPDRLTCSCSPELVRGLLGFVQKIPASSCQRNFTVPSLHISADLRDEGVAAGGDDSPHRVSLLLILLLLPFRWSSTPTDL